MSSKVNRQDIVQALLDAKAVDFAAIGKVLAEHGPRIALMEEDYDVFCYTMEGFCGTIRIHPPVRGGGGTEGPPPNF
jgi:hypothetical protein